ncbi:hypothetical protein F0562_026356 [Nyssa sinensis]|uniref:Uncharacterized protein n=1 Tax=Nyssa sinensis TaxID=561372 RepID=A0A5J5B8T5_9ASTE|nr:hypothetical protein F0562_026356 [Nyssa sinensis]
MENAKQVGASSSSFTLDLFGPMDSSSSSSSSTGLFGSVFGPPSTGLGRDSSHTENTSSLRKQDLGSQYGNAKHGTPGNIPQRSKGEGSGKPSKERNSIYQNEKVEPCNFSSSIYYGGQEVYSPSSQTTGPQHTSKKDWGEDDPNGSNSNSASRGNWWQGSLYY